MILALSIEELINSDFYFKFCAGKDSPIPFYGYGCPCNWTLCSSDTAGFAGELFGERSVYPLDEGGMGSEDFASYTYELPCAYLLLGAGTAAEDPRFGKPMHNENVVFNEDILTRGAALHAFSALKWLAGE